MNTRNLVALGLADAFLAGPKTSATMHERAAMALGQDWPWLRALAVRVSRRFGSGWPHVERDNLARFIVADEDFRSAWLKTDNRPRLRRYYLDSEEMGPTPVALASLQLPQIATSGALAAWLGLTAAQLDWLADRWGNERRVATEPLRHYVYRWLPKRNGDSRLLEIPKSRLRAVQRQILREILDRVPAHEAAHGFRKNRSCLSYVQSHIGQPVVIRMDLKEFFVSIPASRIHALFHTLGYSKEVSRYLTSLCTNRTPDAAFSHRDTGASTRTLGWQQRKQYQTPHLPQGSPSSPALANLAAYRLDIRLSALARTMEVNYTRYADDLAFSGGKSLGTTADTFHILVARIAMEEGFRPNTRKTRVMRRGVRQRLTGIVLNRHPNIMRGDYDRLKATLFNCVRFGPDSQNHAGHVDFRACLAGRIAHVSSLNPARAARLQTLFEKIPWE